MNHRTHAIRLAALGLAAGAALSLASCGECESCKTPPTTGAPGTPGAPAPAPQAAAPAPDATYTVRGKIVMLPDPANPTTEFRVHHEPIPTFKTPDGKVVGMGEMEMPFPVSDPALLQGLAVGDAVEITFADWYKPIRSYKVTSITKLPADTTLNLQDQ